MGYNALKYPITLFLLQQFVQNCMYWCECVKYVVNIL
jgi:hypothetical protein